MLGAREERSLGTGWQLGLRGARGHVVWRQRWSWVLAGRASERDLQASRDGSGSPGRGPHGRELGVCRGWGTSQRLGETAPWGQASSWRPGPAWDSGVSGERWPGGLSAAAETVGEGRRGRAGDWRGVGPWGQTGDDGSCRALGGLGASGEGAGVGTAWGVQVSARGRPSA